MLPSLIYHEHKPDEVLFDPLYFVGQLMLQIQQVTK